MKVTISFEDTKFGGFNKIVVPCDEGEITIQELAARATARYHRIFSKSEKFDILFLKILSSNAILDFEDVVKDVIDDNEMLVACFSRNELYEDDITRTATSKTLNEDDSEQDVKHKQVIQPTFDKTYSSMNSVSLEDEHKTIIEEQDIKHIQISQHTYNENEQISQHTYNENDSSTSTVSVFANADSHRLGEDTKNSSVNIVRVVDTIISEEPDKEFDIYKCGVCYKELPDHEQFLSHQSTHKAECLLKCPKCPQFFTEQSYLDRHISDIHTTRRRAKPVVCEICGKVLKHSSSYRSHMLRHTGPPAHKCTYCDKRFHELYGLKVHTRMHTGERPFWCTISGCGKAFLDASTLKRHESRHKKKINETG